MESQAEMTDERRAELEKLAELAADPETKPEPKKDEKPKSKRGKKKEPDPPSPEEIAAAVASVVLDEMKHWPEEVVALIGEQHPNKESFQNGVPYIIGAYMHFARTALRISRASRKKEAEIKTAKLLGPVATELQKLRLRRQYAIDQTVRDLEKERKEKIQKIKDLINAEYAQLIEEVRGAEPSDEIYQLQGRKVLIEEAFEGACGKIDKQASVLLEKIQDIDEAKDDWNSKKRKERRAALKNMLEGSEKTTQPEQKAVE